MKNIYSTIAMVAFAAILCGSCTQKNKPLFDMPLGVQSYTYRASYENNTAAVLDTIKALGITEMEGPNPKNTKPGSV
ncbi:hypothetical protein ACFQZX_04275 [Mucilaginibacter litoreus]|uniref:Uncharacterized protein n=1 Tax=Mucilaginibacter litoreus TaxID=1048221 RepID=A0ABW3AP81_9SPHI